MTPELNLMFPSKAIRWRFRKDGTRGWNPRVEEYKDYRYKVGGPDISDRDASAFLGFFGKEFDQEIGSYEQES